MTCPDCNTPMKKCKHPSFKFKSFKTTETTGWISMGYRAECSKCGKPLTLVDMRNRNRGGR